MKRFTGLTALALAGGLSSVATAELVTNGGFETGDFAGWTQVGDTGATSVWNVGSYEGTFNAYFGPSSPGGITQVLSANAGDPLDVSFAYLVETDSLPNSMSVSLGGITIFTLADHTNTAWSVFTTNIVSPVANPELTFTFTNPPSFYDLDAVSVNVVPEPTSVLMLGLAGVALLRRR